MNLSKATQRKPIEIDFEALLLDELKTQQNYPLANLLMTSRRWERIFNRAAIFALAALAALVLADLCGLL